MVETLNYLEDPGLKISFAVASNFLFAERAFEAWSLLFFCWFLLVFPSESLPAAAFSNALTLSSNDWIC